MKNFYFLISLFFVTALQAQQFKYIRPSNTGLGGDYFLCVRQDACGNIWTGGYLPFWSEGSLTRINQDGSYTNWSNFEGYIPADRVYDIDFDSFGGVWVASNGVGNGVDHGGISHYDGANWTSWTTANSPLPQDDMRGIAVDHNDVVWCTFLNTAEGIGGVAKFDGTTWTIFQTSNGFPTNYVDKIVVDAQNNIWVSTDTNGLLKYDGTTWTQYDNNNGLSNYIVRDVKFDETTNKLYAVTGNAVDVFDGTSWSHINSSNAPISSNGLWGVDAKGEKIIITTVGGTYKTYVYDGSVWTSRDEIDHTYDALIDNDGNFWTAGNAEIAKYDGTTWTEYGGKNTGLTGMFNDDIFIDNQNRTWFASNDNGGINVFDCPKWQDYNPHNAGLWPSPIDYTGSGSGIAQDSLGDIWMLYAGVLGGVVQIPDGNIDDPDSWVVWDNNNSGISLQFVSRAAGDQSGNLWVGYDGACSVSKYSHATDSWTNYNLYALGQISCGAGSGIKSIRVDADNNVWVCGLAGLAKFDQTNWTFYSYLNTPMQQGLIMDIAFDSHGNKWIATEHGLYKFDGVNWTAYNDQNSGMIADFVTTVLVDDADVVWIGCYTEQVFPSLGGMCAFDGTNWTQYTITNSGLQEKFINRMSLDHFGNLWLMSATHGISIFNPDTVVGYECLDKMLTCSTLAVHDVSSDKSHPIAVYPNPVSSVATIRLDAPVKNLEVTLTDVSGKIVLSVPAQTSQNEIVIDLSQLQNGVYFCRLQADRFNETIKIVKQ
jgi:streptogramin lyase